MSSRNLPVDGARRAALDVINELGLGGGVDPSTIDHDLLLNFVLDEHRLLDDLQATTTNLWSASQITAAIASASGTGEVNTASNIGTAGIGVFKQKLIADLQFFKLNALSNKISLALDGVNDKIDFDIIEANIDHDSLLNFDINAHRLLNDLGTSTTELWSASKIQTQIDNVSESNIDHNLLFNFNVAEHRIINDLGSSTTELWSASKINSELTALAGTVGEVNTVSNIGTAGVGVFKQKTGVDFELFKLNPLSNKISVSLDAINDKIDFDINQANIDHDLLLNFTVNEHRLIDDLGSTVTDLWSASKITAELNNKSDSAHNHTLLSLSERSFNSLTDQPTIPVNHSDLVDDEIIKHRLINDVGTSTTELWSANKIDAAITAASGTGEVNTASNIGTGTVNLFNQKVGVDLQFNTLNSLSNRITIVTDLVNNKIDFDVDQSNIDHDFLLNFDINAHRLLNDLGTSTTELWSASKIQSELTALSLGEINTASNVGTGAVNLFNQKVGVDFEFFTINPLSNKISIALDAINNKIDFDINQANIDHDLLLNFDINAHRLLNDLGTSTTDLWSASKIQSEITAQVSGEINTASNIGTGVVGVFKQKTGVDLEFRTLNSLTGGLTLAIDAINNKVDFNLVPSSIDHDLLLNFDIAEHRIINDLGTGTIDLWSASKIQTQIDNVGEVNIDHNLLFNFDINAHRLLNDVGTSTTDLWSASKIQSEIITSGGEVNTVSNIGTGTVGVFKQKTGVDFELYTLHKGSNKIGLFLDAPNNRITFDVDEPWINHDLLLNFDINAHRLLNDNTTTTTNLWSANKIAAETTLKVITVTTNPFTVTDEDVVFVNSGGAVSVHPAMDANRIQHIVNAGGAPVQIVGTVSGVVNPHVNAFETMSVIWFPAFGGWFVI